MNNLASKILLLAAAFIAAVGGVLFFVNTIVEPPAEVDKTDPFKPDIEVQVAAYAPSSADISKSQNELWAINRRIELFRADGLIDSYVRDENMVNAVRKFTNAFKNWCHARFGGCEWGDINYITRTIGQLRNDYKTLNGGGGMLADSQLDDLQTIEGIIDTYRKARALCGSVRYNPNADPYAVVAQAKSYRNATYVGTCLSGALDRVPEQMAKSHYEYISPIVDVLSNPAAFDNRSAFNEVARKVSDAVDRFENTSCYPSVKGTLAADLWNKLRTHKDAAKNHVWPDERQYQSS